LPASVLQAIAQRFVLGTRIGRGGMATVWHARRIADDKPVALKILRPFLAESIGSQRFLREIAIASDVHAPTLVPLEDVGEANGLPYYVMPLIDGGSLRQRLERERQLPLGDALTIAKDMATALSQLHRCGFVHRDIKPENVLLRPDGHALVADYGIARAVAAAATESFTSTGVVVGTPAYMSPEQAGGEAIDERSDQYAWGCVLYEMLAGTPPFQGVSSQALVARHLHETPPSLRIVRDSVPAAVERVVMRALAKVPADRFANCDGLLEAITAAELAPDAAEPSPPTIRFWRRPVVIAASIAGVAAAGLLSWKQFHPVSLDSSRVVVFPFADGTGARAHEGQDVALMIGSALERAQGTKWLDGSMMLDSTTRAAGISDARARRVAQGSGARYYITGDVSRAGDSVRVRVSLLDAQEGTLVARETETGGSVVPSADLAARAVVRVLPKMAGLESAVDISGLIGHPPAAVHDWLLGEAEYRRYNMSGALKYSVAAATADTTLAPAAFRAAVAAGWMSRSDTARALVRLALRHTEALALRQRQFAAAFERFLAGRANDAVIALRPLFAAPPATADEWMLLGEIQLHLLPTIDLDSLTLLSVPRPRTWPLEAQAERAFEQARAVDPGYAPPLAHLAELAARRGDADRIAAIIRALPRATADSVFVRRMTTTEACLRKGVKAIDWTGEARRSTVSLFYVAIVLSGAADSRARVCGKTAFRAILASDTAEGPSDWGSLVALHGMLAAENRASVGVQLVDSAVATGMTGALALYIVDNAAGIGPSAKAAAFATQLYDNLSTRAAPSLWLLTLWNAASGDTLRLHQVHAAANGRLAHGTRLDSLVDRVSLAFLTLSRHDTADAVREFGALQPTADHRALATLLWESLAPERLTYARLLLATGNPAEAHRIASTFDQPEIYIHQLFLRPSLELRLQAARALGDTVLEQQARARLASLARSPEWE
jgi:serine/threonine-protein kinase